MDTTTLGVAVTDESRDSLVLSREKFMSDFKQDGNDADSTCHLTAKDYSALHPARPTIVIWPKTLLFRCPSSVRF